PHVPPEQVSLVVQALPSSHGTVLGACTQPVAGSHESVVHTFPSSQLRAGPPVHRPLEQVSPVVHALPSSQARVFAACTHPTAGSQESVVQTLPSSQASGGPPWHAPFAHVSRVVHAFPSSHAAVLVVMTPSPVAGSQESSVQTLPSSQCRDWPMHVPAPQASPVVEALPSSHGAVFGVWTQPLPESQESSVQGLPSSQSSERPPTHAPAVHM